MKPKPEFNPWPQSSIPYTDARRSFDAELAAWAGEAMQDAAARIEEALNPKRRRLRFTVPRSWVIR